MITVSENEILEAWNQSIDDYQPLVTVQIMAYNHENYISDALEGVLAQITEYPYQIFVHDDCSTDNTAGIIAAYEERFPHIINAVYEKENLFSKHDGSLSRVVTKNIRGKYVALCEGDDYWIDNQKLQKQIHYMEEHNDCSLTFTNGKILDVQSGLFGDVFSRPNEIQFSNQNQIITLSNVSELRFPPTASYVFRTKDYDAIKCIPTCANGDQRRRLFSLTLGYEYYFSDITCVYRRGVFNSATHRMALQNPSETAEREKKIILMMKAIDSLSDYSYSEEMWKLIEPHAIAYLHKANSLKVLKEDFAKRAFDNMNLINKVRVIIELVLPSRLLRSITSFARLVNGQNSKAEISR